MALDDFSTSDDSTDSTDSTDNTDTDSNKEETTNETSSIESTQPEDMNFYGTGDNEPGTRPMERKGAMSNHSVSDLLNTTSGKLAFGEDNLKLYLPIFTIITRDNKHSSGERYELDYPHDGVTPAWNSKVVCCIGVTETRLGSINKEVAMFNVGSTSKKRVMDKIDSKLGQDLDADTTVYINMFADSFMLRDLAQANEQFRSGDIVDRDKVMTKVLNAKQLRLATEREE